jgi:hypothetical protein
MVACGSTVLTNLPEGVRICKSRLFRVRAESREPRAESREPTLRCEPARNSHHARFISTSIGAPSRRGAGRPLLIQRSTRQRLTNKQPRNAPESRVRGPATMTRPDSHCSAPPPRLSSVNLVLAAWTRLCTPSKSKGVIPSSISISASNASSCWCRMRSF